ncbi:hypothetical protein [Glutamicibacter uratoxydans]|nr:hypothetical protein [Glutamicibacter uratoxydans]
MSAEEAANCRLNSSEAGTEALRILDQTECFALGVDGTSELIDHALNGDLYFLDKYLVTPA